MATENSLEQEIIANETKVFELSVRDELDAWSKRIRDDALAVYGSGSASKKDVLEAVRGISDVHYSMQQVGVIPVADSAGLIVYKMTQDWIEGGKRLARQY